MSTKPFRIERPVGLPDLPDVDDMISDIRNSDPNDIIFQLGAELSGKNLTVYSPLECLARIRYARRRKNRNL